MITSAGELRRLARQLSLDVAPEALAGRGIVAGAFDAFWVAANLAVADGIRRKDWGRLARVYEVQADLLRGEGLDYAPLLRLSFTSVLEALDGYDAFGEFRTQVEIHACECSPCSRDDRRVVRIIEERASPRLPHLDCDRVRCLCWYGAMVHR